MDFALRDPLTSYVVTFDADGQHGVEDAVGMVALLRERGLGAVIGSRFLYSQTQLGRAKRLVLRTAALCTRLSTGMALDDAHNGLRALDRGLVERIDLYRGTVWRTHQN